jgi:hypothetical protein
MPPAASRSSYNYSATNVVAKVIDSNINLKTRIAKPNPWKLTEHLFSIHSLRLPPKQWSPLPDQDTTAREHKISF